MSHDASKALAPGLAREFASLDEALRRVKPSEHRFDASKYTDPALVRLRKLWAQRARFEHRSSTVFAQLALQLYEADASLESQAVMLRMAQDEVRHAGTCVAVLREIGGETPLGPLESAPPLATHAGVSARQRALRNVIYTTCLSELVACARFVASLEGMEDAYLRDVSRALLADERLHGQFGFFYVEGEAAWLRANEAELRLLERYLRFAFATIERELAPLGRDAKFHEPDGEDVRLGIDSPGLAHEVFYGTIEEAAVPGLSRLGIDAERAWKTRTFTP